MEKSKGCHVYAVDVQVRADPHADTHRARRDPARSPAELVVRLAAVIKRRLVVFEWNPAAGEFGDFIETRELALPDVPKAISWVGLAFLIGCKREYSYISVRVGPARLVGFLDAYNSPAGRSSKLGMYPRCSAAGRTRSLPSPVSPATNFSWAKMRLVCLSASMPNPPGPTAYAGRNPLLALVRGFFFFLHPFLKPTNVNCFQIRVSPTW